MAVDSPTASAARRPALLPPLPSHIDPHTPLTAYSSSITALHTLAKQSSTRAELINELVATHHSTEVPLSAVCPLLLHSFCRLRQCADARLGGELQLAWQLWTALRNVVTVRAAQRAFAHCAAFSPLLSCLSELCALPTRHSHTAPLLLAGCQLLANSVAGNSDTQSVFARHQLLSPDLLAIVRSCPAPCLSPLLYALHTLLLSVAQLADGTALFAEFTLRFGQQHQRREATGAADDEDADDGDSSLLFPSLAHRLFLQHASLLPHVSDYLQLHHPAQHHAGLAFLLSSLCTVSSCALELESAAECATVNCVSLLSLLLARHPIDVAERIEDDEGQYALLPSTLQVDEWTHSCVLLVEHVLSSCLAHQPTAASQLPLLRRLFSADVWYLLLSLLSSTNTPTSQPSHEPSSTSSLDSPTHSTSSSSLIPPPTSRPPVPFGFQSDLLRLLCLLASYPSEQPPPFPRLTAVSFLAHTAIAPSQPMQREYSVVGIRGLCRWEEARQALSSMECQAVAGAEEWRRQGVQLTLDPHSQKVRLASSGGAVEERDGTAQSERQQQSEQWPQSSVERGEGDTDMWSVERMAAVRRAGRRVDWGDAGSHEPFDPETDFM